MKAATIILLCVIQSLATNAQLSSLTKPQQSPFSSVTQRIGVTDVTIEYYSPAVKERKIWGEVVPYGQVWRAGANENTTISFEHDVEVEGKALKAGKYGFHIIPGEEEWILIFSTDNDKWGSYSYNQSNDALARYNQTKYIYPYRMAYL